MAKVEAIVGRALRLIGVQDPRQPVQPVDMQTGIAALNTLMRRWEANGLSLGWSDVAAPDEDMPSPPEVDEAIAYNLACRLAPEYGEQPSALVLGVALSGLSDIRVDVRVANPLSPDSLWNGYGYDTRTDTFY